MTGRQQFAIAAVVVGVAGAVAWSATHYLRHELFPVELGSKAPDFTAYTLDSTPKPKRLADYRGQVLMINVWATWCLPCRVEMPSIEALQKDYAQKGLKIVAVSIDDPGTEQAIRTFAQQYKLTFEILHDPSKKIVDAYDIGGGPETILIVRAGSIREKPMTGTDWSSPVARALMDRLLAERTE